ncbi:MAG: DUF1801 domain-containing protein [Chitinophagales bacterium]|nr:DUF1801 domain-containing protein [Chitinophagales bacterium]HAE35536.1 hypothetical protein [Bacteroidota bacterium]HPE98560.1 DUF1801 domain-containing protein [Chitinophagales bacterium]HPR28184.1 DUF1801 domain-containing protein [Chitinophagales bacterium]HQU75402.1 DUF1801 domain-containing protein [Chitinophagales bacterium]
MAKNVSVDLFFERLDHPLKREMLALRELLHKTDNRLKETIRWGAPTFEVDGRIAALDLRSDQSVKLTFLTGAPSRAGKVLQQTENGNTAFLVSSIEELRSKEESLLHLVQEWVH